MMMMVVADEVEWGRATPVLTRSIAFGRYQKLIGIDGHSMPH